MRVTSRKRLPPYALKVRLSLLCSLDDEAMMCNDCGCRGYVGHGAKLEQEEVTLTPRYHQAACISAANKPHARQCSSMHVDLLPRLNPHHAHVRVVDETHLVTGQGVAGADAEGRTSRLSAACIKGIL